MHKAIVQIFSFLEVIQVIKGHQKVKHWICCCYCIPGVPSFRLICIKPQLKHFHLWRSFRSLEIVRSHQKVKHWICRCYCIPGVPSFCLICIKPQLKPFHFWRSFRSLEVIRGHQKVKHWTCYCYCNPWVLSFRLICIKPQLKYFLFVGVIRGHWRSLEIIRRSNTGFVAATGFLGFPAFV